MDIPPNEQPKEKQVKKADPGDSDKMKRVIEELREAMVGDEEDIDQIAMVKMIQKNRAFLLEYAMGAYLDNPKNGELLGSVTSIIAALERTIREDRKERSKKKENEDNAISFNQMMDALQNMNSGSIKLPTFDFGEFILDPSKSIIGDRKFFNPINEHELDQGIQQLDFDGNKI